MPGTVHVKVVKARDLPVMDKRSELTDAFVEVSYSPMYTHVHYTRTIANVYTIMTCRGEQQHMWSMACVLLSSNNILLSITLRLKLIYKIIIHVQF